MCLCCSVGVYSWFTPCNTDSIAVGTVQCYQHSVCNNCVLSLQLHTCWISEAVHSGRDRLLGIVVSEELTAAVYSVIVCGNAVHLFPVGWIQGLFLSDNLSFVTFPLVGGVLIRLCDTINETTGSDNGQLSDKIITGCLNTLTHWHDDKKGLGSGMSIAEHLWYLTSAGAGEIGWKSKRLSVHNMCN